MTYLLLLEIELTLIKLNNMTNFDLYYLTGVLVSVYMIWFYLIKLKRPVYPRHVFLAIVGPFDWKYKPNQSSSAGAVGPMQVMPATANYIQNKKISKNNLKNNVELNIQTSMKLLHKLHKQYSNWKLVCGAYNTGRPIVNSYATFCVNNTNYRNNWRRL